MGLELLCLYYMMITDHRNIEKMKEKEAVKSYQIFEQGLYIGTLELTAAQVREMTAKAAFILKLDAKEKN